MGHVDHGKTSLLDAIRSTEVVAGEAGGITQHIGAYQVHHGDKAVTFLDTPGHEAFTAMRARGARVTDIAVIVVAADDGARPQTDEAIAHAKAAEVPIIVAVNKIDKEGADPMRVRTEMTQRELQPAEWGGDTEFVDVSAKTKQGLDDLLDTILVVAELAELKANQDADASGIVIESKLDPGRGPVGHRPDLRAARSTSATPSSPVRTPAVCARWSTTTATAWSRRSPATRSRCSASRASPTPARRSASSSPTRRHGAWPPSAPTGSRPRPWPGARVARSRSRTSSSASMEEDLKELGLVIKADVAGSVEAIEDEIARLPQSEVQVNIVHSGVGGINESDVMLAAASDAVILGFNVRPVGEARHVAEREGVEIRSYSVIYRALEDLRNAMQGLLEPEEVEQIDRPGRGPTDVPRLARRHDRRLLRHRGHASARGAKVRIVRDGTIIYDTTIDSLKRFNDDVREVRPASSAASCSPTSRTSRRATSWRSTRPARSSASSLGVPITGSRDGRIGCQAVCAVSMRPFGRSSATP